MPAIYYARDLALLGLEDYPALDVWMGALSTEWKVAGGGHA
jgi:hypothetical protein